MGKPTVELDLDPKYARDLYAGGVFIAGCGLGITEECELLVRGAAGEMRVGARVVFVDPSGRGAGLEVVGFGPEMRQRIADLAVPPRAPTPPPVRHPTPPPVALSSPKLELDPFDPLDPLDALDAQDSPPEHDPPTMINEPAGEDVDVNVDVDYSLETQPVGRRAISQHADDVDAELDSESEPPHQKTQVTARAAEPEPEPEAEIAVAEFELPPAEDDLELAPEPPARDISAGSQFDFAMDPALEEVQSYELATDDAEPPKAARVNDPSIVPMWDPGSTQPIALSEMDDDLRDEDTGSPTTGEQPEIGDAQSDAAKSDAEAEAAAHAPRLHERMRGLTLVQQLKYAHNGELQERILLERIYGKAVWEALLRNPRITAQEVARIARMGALPKPLLEQIVGNGAWLQVPEVRRALLTHPRLATEQVVRVLRLLPKHELKLATTQTAYPAPVREHARRLIGAR